MRKLLLSTIIGACLATTASAALITNLTVNGNNSASQGINVAGLTGTNVDFSSTTFDLTSCLSSLGSNPCTGATGISLTTGTPITSAASFTLAFTGSGLGLNYVSDTGWVVSHVGVFYTLATTGNYNATGYAATPGTLNLTFSDPSSGGKFSFQISGGVNSGVPEPASMALLGSGLVALGFIARRRKR